MKHTKIIAAMLVATATAGLFGCGDNNATKTTTEKKDTTAAAPHTTEASTDRPCYDTTGINQSPIHISDDSMQPFSPRPGLFAQVITTKNMQYVKVTGGHPNINIVPERSDENSVNFYGNKYQLIQMHFHSPSEHKINKVTDSMEMHIVFNKAGTNNLIIVGVMIRVDDKAAPNKFIDTTWMKFERLLGGGAVTGNINLNNADLKVSSRMNHYYSYTGSLTSPIYQEGATWIVCTDPMTISTAQLNKFKTFMIDGHRIGGARETQPLNNRLVLKKS